MFYRNRKEAGEKLARLLAGYADKKPLVLAIPRGGVIVAREVAKKLNAPIDIIIPRKIGTPTNPELAVGAITQDGTIIVNRELVERLKISNMEIKEEAGYIINEIKRRLKIYRGNEAMPPIEGRTVILVDDGIATGFTIKAALASIKKHHPAETILAVPVATPYVLEKLSTEVDTIVCPLTPEDFYAVGQFYEEFDQVDDEEVIEIMQEFKQMSAHT